jgi:hypothetical protein
MVALAGLACLAVVACANILGIDDRSLDPLAGGGDGGPSCADPCPMAVGLNHPFAMTVDETNVYWVETGDATDANGSVKACPVSGCGAGPTVYASLQDAPGSIAVDAQNVYWGTGGGAGSGAIWSCAIGGCGGKPTKLVDADTPFGIAVDSTYVYWAEFYSQTVNRAPIAGGSSSYVWDAGSVSGGGTPPNGASQLVIDTGFVYVNDQNASVFRVAIGGGSLVSMFTDPNGSGVGIFGLAVDSNDVYLGATGGIYQMSKGATSGATTLAPNVTLADDLKIDPVGGIVYWSDFGNVGTDGTIGVAPLDGGAPVLLHQQLVTPEALAVNSTDVFWVSYGTLLADGVTVKSNTGTLYRTTK